MPDGYADHPGLAWLRGQAAGRAWLAALPRLVNECAQRWSLALGEPFTYAYCSLALPAKLPDGSDAVLKIQFPDRESAHEAAALAHWDGDGAVRLLAADPERHALLLERCVPGTPLSDVAGEAALDVLVGLLPRLLKPAGLPFRTLADEAAGWAENMPAEWERAGRPFERRLLDLAVDLCRTLPRSAGVGATPVLVHQDLHGDNVLRAQREPWLVIDPKPLLGEPEFAVAPIVRSAELGHARHLVRRRLDRLVDELGLDRERARAWTVAQTIAWGFDGEAAIPHYVEVARWLS